MPPPPRSGAAPVSPEHAYVGGDPSLDLVNTVDWTRSGPSRERLTDYAALTRWAEGAGVLAPAAAERLRREGRAWPRAASAAVGRAQRVRAVLQRVFAATAAGRHAAVAWRDLDAELARALPRLRLAPRPVGGEAAAAAADWGFRDGADALEAPLWSVLWSAARLLTSDEASRIRVCAGPDCGWMYVDRSRNGLRRWCEMRTCGTDEKTRRRRRPARA